MILLLIFVMYFSKLGLLILILISIVEYSDLGMYYVDVIRDCGTKVRQCITSEECRTKNVIYQKRADMIDHLRDVHGISVNIPWRAVGRPRGSTNTSSSRSSVYERQSRVRFKNSESKFTTNKAKFEERKRKALLREWDTLENAAKQAKGPLELFLEREMTKAVESYMKTKDARMSAIQQRIKDGYDAHVLDEYQQVFGDSWRSVQSDSSDVWPYLTEALTKYQDPTEADKLLKIQRELDETKHILHKTIDSVLERGEKLDSLVEKSTDLSAASQVFYKQAKRTNQCCTLL